MPTNPIIQAAHDHIEAGKQINRITVDNRIRPGKVIFEFTDGATADLGIDVDLATFMVLWKNAGNYNRLVGLIMPMEDLA
jgi:hypothetical protein